MKRSHLILIAFSVICLTSGSFEDSLCERHQNFKIISVFNLITDVIIQAKNENDIEFWKISETDTREGFKSISQSVKQTLYKNADSFLRPNPLLGQNYDYFGPFSYNKRNIN